jgi:hypothetical protein
MLAGCVAPGAPLDAAGNPNYDLGETMRQTAEVMQQAMATFSSSGGLDPTSAGGGLVIGLVTAALGAWAEIRRRKNKQNALIAKAVSGLNDDANQS